MCFHLFLRYYLFCADFTHPDELVGVPTSEIIEALEMNGMLLNSMKKGFVGRLRDAAQPKQEAKSSGKIIFSLVSIFIVNSL